MTATTRYGNTGDLYRARQYQSNLQRGQAMQAPIQTQQQQNDDWQRNYNIGKNSRNAMDTIYKREHDNMFNNVDISNARADMGKTFGTDVSKLSDKEIYDQQLMRQQAAFHPERSQMVFGNGEGSFADSLAKQYGSGSLDPKFVSQTQGVLPQAVQQGSTQIGLQTAVPEAIAGQAGGTALGGSALGGAGTLAESVASGSSALMGGMGAAGGEAIGAGTMVEGAGAGTAGGSSALAGAAPYLAGAAALWDLSRGRDDSIIRKNLHHWFGW